MNIRRPSARWKTRLAEQADGIVDCVKHCIEVELFVRENAGVDVLRYERDIHVVHGPDIP
jgi:hypothetical protein